MGESWGGQRLASIGAGRYRRVPLQRDGPTHHPRVAVDLLDEVDCFEGQRQPGTQRRRGTKVVTQRLRVAWMGQREVRGMRARMPVGEHYLTERVEVVGAADAHHEDAVLTESHRRTEVQGERAAGVAEPLLQDVETDRAKFVLSAQCHMHRDEPTLHGIHDLPYRLEVGPTVRRGEQADLHTKRHEGEGAGGWQAVTVGHT